MVKLEGEKYKFVESFYLLILSSAGPPGPPVSFVEQALTCTRSSPV